MLIKVLNKLREENIILKPTTILIYQYILHQFIVNNEAQKLEISDASICKAINLHQNSFPLHKKTLLAHHLIKFNSSKNGVATIYNRLNHYNSFLIAKEDNILQKEKEIITPKSLPTKPSVNKKEVPSKDEFLKYAQTLPNYSPDLEQKVLNKYDAWLSNDWRNGHDRDIRNWKIAIKSTLPYMIQPKIALPTFKRPPSTFNE